MSTFDALNNIAIRGAKKQAEQAARALGSLAEQQLAATIHQNEILIYISKQIAELAVLIKAGAGDDPSQML